MKLFGGPSFNHGDRLVVDGAPVRLAVNPRARRVSLRLDRAKREVVAVAPTPRRLAEAAAFAHERSGWIAERIAEVPAPTPLWPGMSITLFGEPVLLEAAPGRPKLIPADGDHPARIIAPPDAAFTTRVLRVVKREALRGLSERTAHYCARLNTALPPVSVMDARGRWGSCKPASNRNTASIRYSWRLALAPEAVADYVAAHECCHLLEANHGPRFWALVERMVGNHRPQRAWLKAKGAGLHALGRES
ncbi:MAG: metal-dependent hydrolase [Caulobacter sp.]|nr:metal-dependent hydrolase [Caulobacter sp.]